MFQKSVRYVFLSLIFIFLCSNITLALPLIDFIDPTPSNNAETLSTSFTVNVSITESNVKQIKYDWNGTNYTLYNDSLILLLNLNNNSALGENTSRAVDVSGSSSNGTIVNALWNISGKYRGAMFFDGSGDYIFGNHTALPRGALPRTISSWMLMTSNTASVKVPFAYGRCSVGSDAFGYYLSGSEGLNFWGCGGGDFDTGLTLAVGQWHHIAATYNGSHVQMYLRGAPISSATARTLNTGSIGWFVGSDGDLDGSDYPFLGLMDEIMIYNRSLNASEIYQLYATSLTKLNSTTWNLEINQSKNASDILGYAAYTYSASAMDTSNSENATPTRTINIVSSLSSSSVPEFSDYALFFILIISIGGFWYIKQENNS